MMRTGIIGAIEYSAPGSVGSTPGAGTATLEVTMHPQSTPLDRFWAKVEKTDTCWLWRATTRHGYGRFYVDGRLLNAHRWAYEYLVGPIPDGLDLDHLCRVRRCVNPTHLEPTTRRENVLRGTGAGARHAAKTHGVWGHPFDAQNTDATPRKWGRRRCRACRRLEGKRPPLFSQQPAAPASAGRETREEEG
jgi:hypothetical protein